MLDSPTVMDKGGGDKEEEAREREGKKNNQKHRMYQGGK